MADDTKDKAETTEEAAGKAALKAAPKPTITDFAGTVEGPFALYGTGLDTAGQIRINGQVPRVTVIRPTVIKGVLRAPGLDLKPGPVTIEIGGVTFKGNL